MSNFEKAEQLILGRTATAAAKALKEAGLLAPDVQVIRTAEELEALDPDTLLAGVSGGATWIYSQGDWFADYHAGDRGIFPLAVMVSAEQVRAAREAMEEEQELSGDVVRPGVLEIAYEEVAAMKPPVAAPMTEANQITVRPLAAADYAEKEQGNG